MWLGDCMLLNFKYNGYISSQTSSIGWYSVICCLLRIFRYSRWCCGPSWLICWAEVVHTRGQCRFFIRYEGYSRNVVENHPSFTFLAHNFFIRHQLWSSSWWLSRKVVWVAPIQVLWPILMVVLASPVRMSPVMSTSANGISRSIASIKGAWDGVMIYQWCQSAISIYSWCSAKEMRSLRNETWE